jgi:hypothetical protein
VITPTLQADDGRAVPIPAPLWPALLRVVTDPAWRAAALDELDGTSFALLAVVEAHGEGDAAALAASLERPDLSDPRTIRRCAQALQRHLLLIGDAARLATWAAWSPADVTPADLPLRDALGALDAHAGGARATLFPSGLANE